MIRLLVAVALGSVAACGTSGEPAAGPAGGPPAPMAAIGSQVELALDFERLLADRGAAVLAVPNTGSAPVRIEVVTSSDGRARLARGMGLSDGVRFPRYHATSHVPAAALVVRPESSSVDALNPGTRPFRFGADFSLDAESSGAASDNGDNLVQRGLFNDPAQYKIQLDRGVPSCRVKGDLGEAFVVATRAVVREQWYRVSCERAAGRLTLAVDDLTTPDPAKEYVARMDVGDVRVAAPDVALSVGGKVDADGRIAVSSPDQFNGVIDNVFFDARDWPD